jgi:hypothetical protein
MPSFSHLPADDTAALVEHVVSAFGGAGGSSPAQGSPAGGDPVDDSAGKPTGPKDLPTGDASRGEAYFLGERRLANGGAPCAACHDTGVRAGGRLGTDLGALSSKFGGRDGVAQILARPSFKVMRASYEGRPLTDGERADLAAFFAAVEEGALSPAAALPGPFWLYSIPGTLLLFVLMGLLWPRQGASPARRIRGGS